MVALLRRYRTRAALTQEALADRAGLNARGVQHVEWAFHSSPRHLAAGGDVRLVLEMATASRPRLPAHSAQDEIVNELPLSYPVAAARSQKELPERAGLNRRGMSDLERAERRTPHRATRTADASSGHSKFLVRLNGEGTDHHLGVTYLEDG